MNFHVFQIISLLFKFLHIRRRNYFDVIIIRVDALGDYVIWMDALRAYKEKFSGKKVLLICADLIEPLAKLDDFYSEVMPFNRNKVKSDFGYSWNFISNLSSLESEFLYFPVLQRNRIGDMFSWLIKAKTKIAAISNNKGTVLTSLYDKIYTKLIEMPYNDSEIIGIENFTRGCISQDYRYSLLKQNLRYDSNIVPNGEKYIVIAISASIIEKIWPMRHFAKVINSLPKGYRIYITGAGCLDSELYDQLYDLISNKEYVVNMINRTSVLDLFLLISKSCLVIGNDSAAVHIAAANHVPSVCLLHGAHFGRFLPYPDSLPYKDYHPHSIYHMMDCYGCGYNCSKGSEKTFKCLEKVSPEEVIPEVLKVLLG